MKRFLTLCFVAMSCVAFADKICLKSGSFLTGTVGAVAKDEVTFKSDDLGEIKIKLASIAKLERAGEHVLQALDNSCVTVKLAVKDGAYLADGKPVNVKDLKAIDPVAETWHGSVNGAFTAARGNTYANSWSLIANLNRRWEEDRVKFDGGYYYSETGTAGGNRERSTDRWELEGQHDHFWLPKFYSYENLRYERDKIALLDARYRVGLGGGYQWLDGYVQEQTGKWDFNQELGINWVKEEFEDNDDVKKDGFAALRYAHHLKYEPKWNPGVGCFHNLEYLPEVDDWDKYLVKADVGFSTKIIYDFDLLAKIEWEFNSKPASDRKKSDVRYIVGLGYKW